ncbi:hypothetical protein [Streptomyces sp. NPDC001153]
MGRPQPDRRYTFQAVTSLVVGDESDSYLGEVLTDSPHPLSAFQVNIGSASLRGPALMFAAAAASSSDEHAWGRDQATELPGSRDEHDVHEAAAALCRLPNDIAGIVDPGLLATHHHFGVRQAGAVLCMRFPARHHKTALHLARDPDFRVRRALADAAANAAVEGPEIDAIRQILRGDPRHGIQSRAGARRTTSDRAGAPGRTPA